MEFNKFINKLYANNVSGDIILKFVNMYAGKPLFNLTIASEADINLNKVADLVISTNNKPDAIKQQNFVAEQLYGQLYVAGFKGIIRSYYNTLLGFNRDEKGICYEWRASGKIMGAYDAFMETAGFEIDNSPESRPYIIEDIRTSLNSISNNPNKNKDSAEAETQRITENMGFYAGRSKMLVRPA